MDYIAQSKDYWIASNAITISLNALGDQNRVQASVASGAAVMCYLKNNAGDVLIDYDNAHQFQTWPLSLSPTYFNTDTPKYVYCAIPRTAEVGTTAVIVFPSEMLDVYGINANGTQVGSEDYYYIFLQGIIGAVEVVEGIWKRTWTHLIDTGSKGTDEALDDKTETDWYLFSKISQIVTFLKPIVMDPASWFQNLRLGNSQSNLTGVATAMTPDGYVDADYLVATPSYINANSLSKKHDDVAEGNITFEKDINVAGLANMRGDAAVAGNLGVGGWIKAALGLFKTLRSENYTGNTMNDTGYELTSDDGNGNSRLVVDNIVARMKFIANILEVRKLTTMGGNYVFSPAASVIEEVDYFGNGTKYVIVNANIRISGGYYITSPIHLKAGNTMTITDAASQYHSIMTAVGSTYLASDTYTATEDINVVISSAERGEYEYEMTGTVLLGYEYIKSPWLLKGVPMFLQRTFNSVGELLNISGIFSTRRLIRSKMSVSDWNNVTFFRCWLKADDGSTKTINTWRTGMLARCQTFDASQIDGGTHTGDYKEGSPTSWAGKSVTNKLYWRAVGTTGQGLTKSTYTEDTKVLDDGKAHNYIDLSNVSGMFLAGSDRPSAGDNIVCYGDYLHQETSNIITIETVGEDAPSFKEYVDVGYSNGSTIDWTNALVDKMKTRISPVAGNRFVAPEFLIEITEPGGTKSYVNLKVTLDSIIQEVSDIEDSIPSVNLMSLLCWTSNRTTLLENDVKTGMVGEANMMYSPQLYLQAGTYTFSAYMYKTALTNVRVLLYMSDTETGTETSVEYSTTESTETYMSVPRCYFTFTLAAAKYVRIRLDLPQTSAKITTYRPQLEAGDEMTAYQPSADAVGTTGYINVTANEVNLGIRNGLLDTGINISTGEVNLIAGKVNFKTSGGQTNPKISIDPATGALNAVDGNFEGTVKAVNLYVAMMLVWNNAKCWSLDVEPTASHTTYFWYHTLCTDSGFITYQNNMLGSGNRYSVGDIIPYDKTKDTADFFDPSGGAFGWIGIGYFLPYTKESSVIQVVDDDLGQLLDGISIPAAKDYPGKRIEIYNRTSSNTVKVYAREVSGSVAHQFYNRISGYPTYDATYAFVGWDMAVGRKLTLYSDGTYWLVVSYEKIEDDRQGGPIL